MQVTIVLQIDDPDAIDEGDLSGLTLEAYEALFEDLTGHGSVVSLVGNPRG